MVVVAFAAATTAHAQVSPPPWEVGASIREDLFEARSELAFGNPSAARALARRAQRTFNRGLRRQLESAAPRTVQPIERGLRSASDAATDGDVVSAAMAQGTTWAAILDAARVMALKSVESGDTSAAAQWLKLRDFRTATRFTRPATGASDAVRELKAARIDRAAAALAIEKDLLDTYQARQRELFLDVEVALEKDFKAKAVEAAAQLHGYWKILRGRFREDFGSAALSNADDAYRRYIEAVSVGAPRAVKAAKNDIDQATDGFVAAPFTVEEEARRAQQLLRFLELVPTEYEQGVKDGRVTVDFEIQEAVGFRSGAEAAFGDLKGKLQRRDPARTARVAESLEELRVILKEAQERRNVVDPEVVERTTAVAITALNEEAPKEWLAQSDESDFDLIALTLDRMYAAISQGQWSAAEQARLETYAFLEFGPELKLRAFDPQLALELEGLIWFGADHHAGLAALIANHATRVEVRPTRVALDKSLAEAKSTLGDEQSTFTAITNGAILVFREGLEAVLILAAITASMIGVMARRRRFVLIGAAVGLVLSIVTWGVAQLILGQLGQYGEKLEAIVGVIAIVVLLYVMNWFFHKVYWTGHIRKFHDRRRRLIGDEVEEMEGSGAEVGFWSGQAIGFALLGLSSVYREGFETVLFLQSLQLATDTRTVVIGALLGLALTGAVAVVTFKLQRRLPYKRMLIVTGVLLALVLFVLVGNTVRSLQGVGWMPVTPIDVEFPLWVGTWLGMFPSWQSLGAQFLAVGIVVGSYFLAEELRVKRPRRRAYGLQSRDSNEVAPS